MKNYERPIVMINEDLAEGVYAASGCWTSWGDYHQTRSTGMEQFCFQVNGLHIDERHNGPFIIEVTFDQDVSIHKWENYTYLGAKDSLGKVHSFYIDQFTNQGYCNSGEGFGAGGLYVNCPDETVKTLNITNVKISDNGL